MGQVRPSPLPIPARSRYSLKRGCAHRTSTWGTLMMKMKQPSRNSLGALALVLALPPICWPAYAEDKGIPIVGTWQVTSFALLELDTNKTSYPFGGNPGGYIQYSPGGHMVVFLQSGNPKRPANFPYTDADRGRRSPEHLWSLRGQIHGGRQQGRPSYRGVMAS